MVVLGLSGGLRQGYQDTSACIVEGGKVVAAIEEERLNRIKFSPGKFPYLSVIEVLKIAGKDIKEVNYLAFHGSTWGSEIESKLSSFFIQHFGYSPPILRFHHHDCHAASAYYASGYNEALILSIDNSGDGVSLQISKGINGSLSTIKRFSRPNSIGLFYQLITQYCGFVKDSDEYKLMGLSSYGNKQKYNFDWLIDFNDGELLLNTDYINTVAPNAPSLHKDEMVFNEAFCQRLGSPRRLPHSSLSNFYKDIAASAQLHLETLLLKIIDYYVSQTGLKSLCLAGGVALNCVANQRIMNSGLVNALYVQPASSDAGISLGAAWLGSAQLGIAPIATENTYLGNSYTNNEIEAVLNGCGVAYTKIDNPATVAAELISKEKVIGWFQGRMEFGPRALGNRSILANATGQTMQDIVNRKIKLRESFRPFCPSILEEDAELYFEGMQTVAPYMTITYNVKTEMQQHIPAVTHVDGTARIQTVNRLQNELYYGLLKNLKRITGHGVVLNTSFNLSHEPIVQSPRNALASFYSCGLDALIIGNYLVRKDV